MFILESLENKEKYKEEIGNHPNCHPKLTASGIVLNIYTVVFLIGLYYVINILFYFSHHGCFSLLLNIFQKSVFLMVALEYIYVMHITHILCKSVDVP